MRDEREPDTWSRCPDCGKIRYFTRKLARRAARRIPGPRLRAYRCGSFWHLTSISARRIAWYRSRGFR